jgi:hypothetical protein
MLVLFALIVAALHVAMHHHPMALVGKAGENGAATRQATPPNTTSHCFLTMRITSPLKPFKLGTV